MILFLYGPDTYRSREKLKEITGRYKEIHKTGMSFYVLDTQDHDFDDFRNAAGVVPMFGEKKLVVLKDFASSKEFSEKFLSWSAKVALRDEGDVVCLFFEGACEKKDPLVAWFLKNAKCQEFEVLSGARLKKWAEQFLQRNGILMQGAALSRLLCETKGNLWAFESEVRKTNAYARSMGKKVVTGEDLDLFLRPALETHIFALTDAVVSGDKAGAWKLLKGHLEAGDNENYLFTMMYHQFRNIAQVHDCLKIGEYDSVKIAKACNIHPFVAKKSAWQAKNFDKEQIKKIYRILADLDYGMKTGRIEPQAALEQLILAA